jgi:hypothetical protein
MRLAAAVLAVCVGYGVAVACNLAFDRRVEIILPPPCWTPALHRPPGIIEQACPLPPLCPADAKHCA